MDWSPILDKNQTESVAALPFVEIPESIQLVSRKSFQMENTAQSRATVRAVPRKPDDLTLLAVMTQTGGVAPGTQNPLRRTEPVFRGQEAGRNSSQAPRWAVSKVVFRCSQGAKDLSESRAKVTDNTESSSPGSYFLGQNSQGCSSSLG